MVKQRTGMRIAARRQFGISTGLVDVQPTRIQLRMERQIPTAANPTTKSVADTRKPLYRQVLVPRRADHQLT